MKIRKIADAAVVAAMLMISVPSLMEDPVQISAEAIPAAIVENAPDGTDAEDSRP